MQMKFTDLVFTPRSRVIWAALAAFLMGSALCPFNPPAGEEPNFIKQGETMNAPLEKSINNDTTAPGLRAFSSRREIETATFALG